jgi:hypothetical protein
MDGDLIMCRRLITRRLNRCAPAAYSLLEVVLASALCASVLVPALAFLRDGIAQSRNIDNQHLLLAYGVGTMEEQLAQVAAGWNPGSSNGSFAAEGHPNIRYSVFRSHSPPNGGIPNRLMSVTVTTYYDEDGDSSLDSDESSVTLTTKIGKFVTYENEASS